MKKAGRKELSDESDARRIEFRDYELYEQRGVEPGHELEDWLEAEQEIRKIRMAEEPESPELIDKGLGASGR